MDMEMNAEMDRDEGSEEGEPSEAASSAGSVFCTLEQDYAKLLSEMKENEALAPYEAEYTRLFESLYKSRKIEEELMEKFRELEEDATEKSNKIIELEKTVEYQGEMIIKLNENVMSASKLTDAAHTRELNAQEIIENLRLTITKLNHKVDQTNKQLAIDEDGILAKQRDSSAEEREQLTNELEMLRQRIKSMSQYTEELEEKTSTIEHQMNKIQENLDEQMDKISKEQVARDKIEKHAEELEQQIKIRNNELQAANATIKATANNAIRLENSLKEQKNNNEKLCKEVSKLMASQMSLQMQLNSATRQVKEMNQTLIENSREHKITVQDNKRLMEELAKYKMENEWSASKYAKMNILRGKIEKDLEDARHALSNVETEMNSCRHELAQEKKSTEWALREKNVLSKTLENLKDSFKKMQQLISMSEISKRKLEYELEKSMQMNNMKDKTLQALEKQRDKLSQETKQLTEQTEHWMNKTKEKDMAILSGKNEVVELSKKIRQQQNLLESIRAERNVFNKNLTVAKDEYHELQDKWRVMTGQIQHLQEEIANKSRTISKGEFRLGKVEKEKEALRLEMEFSRKEIFNLRQMIGERKEQEKQQKKDLKTTEIDASRLKKEVDNILNERDVLGTQLVRRNDQLNIQYDKIKVMDETLHRGASDYNQKLEDIRLLKLEVGKLRAEKMLLMNKLKNMGDYRHEIFHLDRDLTRERLKVTALEEELENPLNIHRWRKLAGCDPSTIELLKKVQILQKRILKMSHELVLKTKKIKDTEKLYMDLREILSKQPGPEFIVMFEKTREALRERGQKIKSLNAELNMWECRTNEHESELKRISGQLQIVKMKYYALKRKTQITSINKEFSACSVLPTLISPDHKKYSGGGFTMLVAPSQNCSSLPLES